MRIYVTLIGYHYFSSYECSSHILQSVCVRQMKIERKFIVVASSGLVFLFCISR